MLIFLKIVLGIIVGSIGLVILWQGSYLLYQIGSGPFMAFRRRIEVKSPAPGTSDAIIIFFHGGISPDDGVDAIAVPTLRKAVYLLGNGYASRIIIGSAPGPQKNPGPSPVKIAEWIEAAGINRDLILIQQQSPSVNKGMLEIRKLCESQKWESVTIIGPEHTMARLLAPWSGTEIKVVPVSMPFDGSEGGPPVQAALITEEIKNRCSPCIVKILGNKRPLKTKTKKPEAKKVGIGSERSKPE